MPLTCILFAAGLDWLENLLPFLFVGFWILSQVFGVFRRAVGNGQPGPPPAVPLPEPERAAPRRAAPPPMNREGREELEKQIEEFLRRVTGEPTPKPVVRQKPAPVVKPAPIAKPALPEASVVTDVASHVREAFAHDLKHDRTGLATSGKPLLPATTATTSKSRAKVATELAQALRNPASIRQAILLREVLERPADRW